MDANYSKIRHQAYRDYSAGGFVAPVSYGYGNARLFKKRSGCRMKYIDKDKPFVWAWRVSRRYGFISAKANPYKKQNGDLVSKSGRNYIAMCVEYVVKDEGVVNVHTGYFDIGSSKLWIPKLGLVMNPHAANGGYFGRSGRPKNK